MLKLVIFDFDGVIIDSEPLMKYAFEESYKLIIGDGLVPTETFFLHMGESLPRIIDRLGLSRKMVKPYCDISSSNIDKIKMFPGTINVLETISSLNLKMILLTGKDYKRTYQILRHFDILNYFRLIVTPDSLWNSKPDPEGIVYILDAMNCSANEAIMVGDSLNDIICAQRCGVNSVGVCWGNERVHEKMRKTANFTIYDWGSLIDIILQKTDFD